MCIISGDVETVEGTNIFVAPATKNRQFTVYANTVAMRDDRGVMVLPFPRGQCDMIDLTDYPTLFEDLKEVCPVDPMSLGLKSYFSSTNGMRDALEVKQVGSYKASIVPSSVDFGRLRQDLFPIKREVIDFLTKYYPQDMFSFMVCRLDQNKTYHPFGYLHQRAPEGALFIPTLHYHDHHGRHSVDWDHRIFCLNTTILNLENPTRVKTQNHARTIEETVQFNKLPRELEKCSSVTGYRIDDYHLNHDLIACA